MANQSINDTNRGIGMKIHELKTVQPFFDHVVVGLKTFEVRKNDRNFAVGDWLTLREWIPGTKEYTGRRVNKEVIYMTDFEQKPGYVVMAIAQPHTNRGIGMSLINRIRCWFLKKKAKYHFESHNKLCGFTGAGGKHINIIIGGQPLKIKLQYHANMFNIIMDQHACMDKSTPKYRIEFPK